MADGNWSLDPGPDARAVDFLRAKGVARSWRWTSLWNREHAFAFTLAGVHRLDVIAAAQGLTVKAAAEGETYETFRDQFEDRMRALGFFGPQLVTDFAEGPREVDLTASWRMKVIYDTNVRQAYAAAEWQAIQDTKADFPALMYMGVDDEVTRASHRQWFGVVLPVDHPFWSIWYPPNDWYCRCFVIQVSAADLASGRVKLTTDEELARRGISLDPATWPEWRHPASGRVDRVPPGIGPGFGYNAGMARRENLADLLSRRIEGMDPDLARAAAADLTNFPQFQDMVADAVALGIGRAQARADAAGRLIRQGLPRAEAVRLAEQAADQAGSFGREAWPVAVAPRDIRELAPDGAGLVVANPAGIGHSADLHPTAPADWGRVQALLDGGWAYQGGRGELTILGRFVDAAGAERTWAMAVKPVGGAWRVKTLHPSSPRRWATIAGRMRLVRQGAEDLPF